MRIRIVLAVLAVALVGWWAVEKYTGTMPTPVQMITQPAMENLAHEISDAFATLNQIRDKMGMAPLSESHPLQQAAQAHADYLVRHRVTSHFEDPSTKGFTGTKPVDRALRAGFGSRFVGENLSTNNTDALSSVAGLFSAIYHRFAFLNLAFDTVGIGVAQDRDDPRNSAFVYLLGNQELHNLCTQKSYRGNRRYVYGVCADTGHRIESQTYTRARNAIKERNPKVVLYPYDGQQEVPPVFYEEHPDPLPDRSVSGFPVSVEFNDRYFRKVDLVSFRLHEVGGADVKDLRLLDKRNDPNHELSRRQFALLPLSRLKYGTTYRVEVVYRHKGKRKTLRWSFTTRKPTEELIVIRKREQNLHLKAGKGYWLYFEPDGPDDVLGTVRFPKDLYVTFIDRNTMRIVLDAEQSGAFEIGDGKRQVHVTVE